MNERPAAPGRRRHAAIGLTLVLVVFGGFGLWAALAPLSSAAIGAGVVSVDRYRKTVQHLEGGIVGAIRVRDGESVTKDQVLVVLDDTQPKAQLEVLRGQYFTLLAREARLVAERDGAARPVFAPDLEAARADPRAADAMRIQQQTFFARKHSHDGEIALLGRQVQQMRAKVTGLAAQRSSREQLAASYEAERADFDALVNQGYAERQRLREMERALAQTEGQRGALVSDIAATEFQIDETQAKVLQLSRELQREVAREMAQVQDELASVREKTRSLQDVVDRTVIRAPDAGIVLGLEVHTLGAVVRPGARLLDIVPQNAKLVVEARLLPQDIDQVRIGQAAEVRFPAFNQRDLPRIEGRLVSLSADRLLDEQDGRRTPYYLARVEVSPEGQRALAQAKFELVPGMPAEVLVQTGERTLLQYLVGPLTHSVTRSLRQD